MIAMAIWGNGFLDEIEAKYAKRGMLDTMTWWRIVYGAAGYGNQWRLMPPMVVGSIIGASGFIGLVVPLDRQAGTMALSDYV